MREVREPRAIQAPDVVPVGGDLPVVDGPRHVGVASTDCTLGDVASNI